MAVSVLIVTPTTAFGEIIRQALTEDGGYRPVLVFDAQEAMRHANQHSFEVVILDTDLGEPPLVELELALRRTSPSMRLIVIPRKGDLSLSSLSPDLFLTKPFYMPDLLEKLDEILSPVPVHVSEKIRNELAAAGHPAASWNRPASAHEVPSWLEDATRAAQHLTRLSLETAAQASLITRDSELWAYAGHLPQEAAAELAAAVLKDYDWSAGASAAVQNSDLARFIHLETTDCDYMLYTTGLGDRLVLAMAFDAQMPFSKMRAQTGNLARALATPPSQDQNLPTALKDEKDSDGDEAKDTWIPEPELDERLTDRLTQPFMTQDDILPPSPAAHRSQDRIYPANAGSTLEELTPEVEFQPAGPEYRKPPAESGASSFSDLPSASAGVQPETVIAANISPDDAPGLIAMAAATSTWHHLSYALVLLPRLPQQFITGDLSDQMADTLQRLSLSFGWRLEHLAVRPEYLLLVVALPPEISPEAMVTDLKKHTSLWIFDDFPRLGRENPSGDFWAPGYLLITATQPPDHQVVRTFIEQTRRVQGIPGRK
jgi:REP element-mobilizing transposase RayT/DNA-binding response OmpR family regulator